MATLRSRLTWGWETFQGSDRTGDLGGGARKSQSSLVAELEPDRLSGNRDIAVRVMETTAHAQFAQLFRNANRSRRTLGKLG